jgi:hypothetical protein
MDPPPLASIHTLSLCLHRHTNSKITLPVVLGPGDGGPGAGIDFGALGNKFFASRAVADRDRVDSCCHVCLSQCRRVPSAVERVGRERECSESERARETERRRKRERGRVRHDRVCVWCAARSQRRPVIENRRSCKHARDHRGMLIPDHSHRTGRSSSLSPRAHSALPRSALLLVGHADKALPPHGLRLLADDDYHVCHWLQAVWRSVLTRHAEGHIAWRSATVARGPSQRLAS